MNSLFSNFRTAFIAEHIKVKRTGVYISAIIAGVLVPVIHFLFSTFKGSQPLEPGLPFNYFERFTGSDLGVFNSFFFPLFIIILISKITQLDHKNGGWKLMETHPLYKSSIYFSKLSVVFVASIVAIVSFLIMDVLAASILSYTAEIPANVSVTIPWAFYFQVFTRLAIACMALIAMQYALSVIISNFITPLVIGLVLLIASPILANYFHIDWSPIYILSSSDKTSEVGSWFLFTDYIGLILSITLLTFGFIWYKNKTFKLAFWSTNKQRVFFITGMVLSTGMVYFLMQPNQIKSYATTIVNGKIDSDLTFKNVYISDNVVGDTLAIIPIKDGEFHYEFTDSIIANRYSLIFDNKFKYGVFFGSNDSIYIHAQFYNQNQKYTVTGTRLAENAEEPQPFSVNWEIQFSLSNKGKLPKIEDFSELIYDDWQSQLKNESSFRTADNYVPKNDFKDRKNKIGTANLLNYWEDFVKAKLAIEDGEAIADTPEIEELRATITLSDESLLSSKEYSTYLKSQLIKNNTSDLDEDTQFLMEIANLPEGKFKDKLLFKELYQKLEFTTSTAERQEWVNNYTNTFENPSYTARIITHNKALNAIGKGKPAANFKAIKLDETPVQLTGLKGKYVLIDVWASWCGPCKSQAPFFDKFAKKYVKENIQFVSLSVDENKDNWTVAAKGKSKFTLNVWNLDQTFMKEFQVTGIPRFILIDPDGNIANAKMPRPSDSSFEIILRKELGLPDEM